MNVRFSRLFSLSLDKGGVVASFVDWKDGVGEWKWRWRRELFKWELELVSEL